ncbi:MAG: hypothetical protein LQ337_004820 [Flavoplaca oasis]|nr:MAG: hypothetical protein LQ337_004820 [Flavoplaca oasis]
MTRKFPRTADFIIVGGGTSGLVLAHRLSEDPNTQVLVLESGKSIGDDPRVQNPSAWTTLLGPETAWQLATVPQPGLNNRVEMQFQGKALGGSSMINGSAFIAPSRAGIDTWSNLGNNRWTYEVLVPHYRAAHSVESPDPNTCKDMGIDLVSNIDPATTPKGPVQVSFPSLVKPHPVAKAWNEVFKGKGYNTTAELFPIQSAGNRCYTAAIDPQTQKRSSSDSQYGGPVSKRPNLTIATGATVLKIVLSGSSSEELTAEGVEAAIDGTIHAFMATKEVILAAGAFHTPKLLELSGVGERSRLQSLGIPAVIDNAGVGEHLQNHVMCMRTFELNDNVQAGDGIQSLAFLPLQDRAQQQMLFDTAMPTTDEEKDSYDAVRAVLDDPNEASCSMFMTFIGLPNFISLGVMQSIPFSRGGTHIASAEPDDNPRIDPQLFSNTLDLELMARHLLTLEKLPSTSPLSAYFKENGQRIPSEMTITDLQSAREYLRQNAVATHHSCGTAAMLPREKGGVVDQNLVVYGTRNLRVVDASIFPVIPQANPMSTVYAVAERAASLIKGGSE